MPFPLQAASLFYIWISIDSADALVHEKLRGLKGVVKGIEISLPIFHKAGIYPSVNLGINRFLGGNMKELRLASNSEKDREFFFFQAKTAFKNFYEFVIQLAFTIANACYPMGAGDESMAVYSALSKDDIVNFTQIEKILLFKALKKVIPFFLPLSILFPFPGICILKKNREFLSLWVKDLNYYRACDYFNGRKSMNLK